MGQYWGIFNLTKRQSYTVSPLQKLLEIMCNTENGRAMAILLAARGGSHAAFGSWAGDRVTLIGHYADPSDVPAEVWASVGVDINRKLRDSGDGGNDDDDDNDDDLALFVGMVQVPDDGDVSELVSDALGDLDYWKGEFKNDNFVC